MGKGEKKIKERTRRRGKEGKIGSLFLIKMRRNVGGNWVYNYFVIKI